jgi:hypothetical protein
MMKVLYFGPLAEDVPTIHPFFLVHYVFHCYIGIYGKKKGNAQKHNTYRKRV